MKSQDRKPGVDQEVAILVGVQLPDSLEEPRPLDELRGLAETAGAQVADWMVQRRDAPVGATYLGGGKVEELKALVEAKDADVVLFDNELTPAQARNLERALEVKVLDRTELILDIFASHAKTYEARLAVELAQLEYALPRLKRMWTHLSRMKMGIGMRGPGEKQLEVDRRLVEKRIHDLRGELAEIERRREREVAARSSHRTVSLVGYTNSGKSTLMNVLTGAGVKAQDQLFATLDTRTRRWQLPHWGPVLLSDTVGFIRNLPHRLIASFKATLEEARRADLLLHIADAANPAAIHQIRAVFEVLAEIGIEEKDTLLVLNKIDAAEAGNGLESLRRLYPNAIPISARLGTGLDQLKHVVSDTLSREFLDVQVETDVGNGKAMAFLSAHGEVLSRRFEGERAIIHCRIPAAFLGRLEEHDARVVTSPGPCDLAGP